VRHLARRSVIVVPSTPWPCLEHLQGVGAKLTATAPRHTYFKISLNTPVSSQYRPSVSVLSDNTKSSAPKV